MKKAFTLAEVLITLAVIGVIAAVSVPSLQNSINDKQYKASFVKKIAEISQAYSKLTQENGGTLVNVGFGYGTNSNLIKPYLSYTKSCDWSAVSGGCWHSNNQWFLLDNSLVAPVAGFNENSSLILNDGSLLIVSARAGYNTVVTGNGWLHFFSSVYDGCGDGGSGNSPVNTVFALLIDTNGFKKPNTVGKDIFMVYVGKNGEIIVPQNCSTTAGFLNAKNFLMGQ